MLNCSHHSHPEACSAIFSSVRGIVVLFFFNSSTEGITFVLHGNQIFLNLLFPCYFTIPFLRIKSWSHLLCSSISIVELVTFSSLQSEIRFFCVIFNCMIENSYLDSWYGCITFYIVVTYEPQHRFSFSCFSIFFYYFSALMFCLVSGKPQEKLAVGDS